ncbi:MAG: glutathione peroxidase [Actinobacteria bacterium]|nr:MAG: glutathione peroxidase [Actinomycetota bacterium]
MSVYETKIARLDGTGNPFEDVLGKVTLLVNVASKCGLTPQYSAMQKLHADLSAKGFSVLGVPCNQFMGQEPGNAQEIQEFCSTTYGIDFPLSEKVDVNGDARHALYTTLTTSPDAEGYTGDIRWNFEKFLIGRNGEVVARFGPQVEPDAPEVLAAITSALG